MNLEELNYQALKANARPSLERPPAGTCCPRCSEPLELEGYCGVCDWREGEVETW